MKSKLLNQLGYFMVDHRFSPGVSAELAQTSPGNPIPVGEGKMFEADIKTCSHCQAVVILNPDRTRPRNWCSHCDAYVCDNPGCNQECKPYVKYLDELDRLDTLNITV